MNKISKIDSIISGLNIRTLDRYAYALYSTLTMSDLCELYFHYVNDTETKNKIIKHIHSRVRHRDENISISFKKKLLAEFLKASGRLRIAHGTTIKDFSKDFSKNQLAKFFYAQIYSEKILDRKRSYVIAEYIFDKQVAEALWKSWIEHFDKGAINVWIKYSSDLDISKKFKHIWNSEHVSRFSKHDALKRLAVFDFSYVSFLKDVNPVSYLTACVSADNDIDDTYCLTFIKNITDINTLGYVLWCLGMLGKASFLESIIEDISLIEKKCKKEFWEFDA